MNKTHLHQRHVQNGANMAEFAFYSMPLWYPEGVKSEHLGVVESCGLFDATHMAVVLIRGEEGHALLQKTFSKELGSGRRTIKVEVRQDVRPCRTAWRPMREMIAS